MVIRPSYKSIIVIIIVINSYCLTALFSDREPFACYIDVVGGSGDLTATIDGVSRILSIPGTILVLLNKVLAPG